MGRFRPLKANIAARPPDRLSITFPVATLSLSFWTALPSLPLLLAVSVTRERKQRYNDHSVQWSYSLPLIHKMAVQQTRGRYPFRGQWNDMTVALPGNVTCTLFIPFALVFAKLSKRPLAGTPAEGDFIRELSCSPDGYESGFNVIQEVLRCHSSLRRENVWHRPGKWRLRNV